MSQPNDRKPIPIPSSSAQSSAPETQYIHNGRAVSSLPLTARLSQFGESAYVFLGLYFTTLLSFDATAAAASSPFATQNRVAGQRVSSINPFAGMRGSGGSGSGSGGGGSASGRGSGGGSGGRRLGTVDDVRGPECKSCG